MSTPADVAYRIRRLILELTRDRRLVSTSERHQRATLAECELAEVIAGLPSVGSNLPIDIARTCSCPGPAGGPHVRGCPAYVYTLEHRIRYLEERIASIADEAFGPFPVQSAQEMLTAIERGIFEMRQKLAP